MSTGTLFFSLLAGLVGAGLAWWATRCLSARLSRKACAPPAKAQAAASQAGAQGTAAPAPGAGTEQEICAARIHELYQQVLVRRLLGLLLCVAALAAWLTGLHWSFCLVLAGAGCVVQYLAYRLRTCYALHISRQKQLSAAALVGAAGVRAHGMPEGFGPEQKDKACTQAGQQ